MKELIAITGKGGTGKTTLAACLVRLLLEDGTRPVLAVDADPNSTLAPLLGLPTGTTISDIRQEMLEGKTDTTAISKDRILELKLEDCIQEADGFDLLTMGRPEGPSCYCYVNNLLRGALQRLRKNYQAVVVDNEAGMEHLSRMNTDAIDHLLIVCEPTLVSARSAARIVELASSLSVSVRRTTLVWNKVRAEGIPERVGELLDHKCFDRVIELPYNERVAQLSALEENALEGEPLPSAFDELRRVATNCEM